MPRLSHCCFGNISREPHQRALARTILKYLSPGCGAVDVGMMYGWASWHMLFAVRGSGTVWGLDPKREYCDWVRQRFPENMKVVECHASSFTDGHHYQRIDDIVDAPIHFIKIDTDTAKSDHDSLIGAKDTIMKWKPIITIQEINDDIRDFFHQCGYRCQDESQPYDRLWLHLKRLDTH